MYKQMYKQQNELFLFLWII